jgi:serpin B
MVKPFSESQADFSGISNNIYIDTVLHKAIIEVDEKGTVAAASTVIGIPVPGIVSPKPIKYFTADHPFLYAIVDDHYGTILFIGKMKTPPTYVVEDELPSTNM